VEIILDADVIISGEKNIFDLPGWLASRADDRFEVAAITIAELWHGVERASAAHRARRQKYLEAFVAVLPIIAYTEETAYFHARLWSDLETSRQDHRRLRPNRGGHGLTTRQYPGYIQPTPLLAGKGSYHPRT
jgi:predicted nucleic acid-binding protein